VATLAGHELRAGWAAVAVTGGIVSEVLFRIRLIIGSRPVLVGERPSRGAPQSDAAFGGRGHHAIGVVARTEQRRFNGSQAAGLIE